MLHVAGSIAETRIDSERSSECLNISTQRRDPYIAPVFEARYSGLVDPQTPCQLELCYSGERPYLAQPLTDVHVLIGHRHGLCFKNLPLDHAIAPVLFMSVNMTFQSYSQQTLRILLWD